MAYRYKMDSDPHGFCIIFNNEFMGVQNRKGTNKDRLELKSLFKTLNYKVIVEENKNAHEMISCLQKISRCNENKRFDSFVCCFLSHGNESGIYGNDQKSLLRYTTIWSLFGQESSTLRNKPKIFVVQSCQTPVKTISRVVDQPSDFEKMDIDADSFDSVRNDIFQEPEFNFDQGLGTQHADMFFIHSSVPGRLSYIRIFLLTMKYCVKDFHYNFQKLTYNLMTQIEQCYKRCIRV